MKKKSRFNNLIGKMKAEKMTDNEKELIRFRLTTFMGDDSTQYIFKSPYLQQSPYFSKFSLITFTKITVAVFLLVVLGFGGLAYASTSTVPGDLFYPVKKLGEKIAVELAPTPAKKAAVRYKNIKTRFQEAEKLIDENKMTPAKQAVVEAGIKEEKENIVKDLEEVKQEDPVAAVQTEASVQTLIETHQDIITTMIDEKKDDVDFIENELNNNDISFEEEFNTDLKTIEDTELDVIENYPTENTVNLDGSSLIQDAKIIPDITSLTIPITDTTPITSEKIDNTSTTNTEDKSQNNY